MESASVMSGSHHPFLPIPGGRRKYENRPGATRKELFAIELNTVKLFQKKKKNCPEGLDVDSGGSVCLGSGTIGNIQRNVKGCCPDGRLTSQRPNCLTGAQDQEEKLSSKAGLEPRTGRGRAKQREWDSPTLPLITSQGIFKQPERCFYS